MTPPCPVHGTPMAPAPGSPVKSPDCSGSYEFVCPVDGQRFVVELQAGEE